jgi:hypothetical protein
MAKYLNKLRKKEQEDSAFGILEAGTAQEGALAVRTDDGSGMFAPGELDASQTLPEFKTRRPEVDEYALEVAKASAEAGPETYEDEEPLWSFLPNQELYGTSETQLAVQETMRQQDWAEELQVQRGVLAQDMQLAQFSPCGEPMEFELNPPVWTAMRSKLGEVYWYNFRTGEVALADPTINPDDLEEQPDSEPEEAPHEKFMRQGRSGKYALDGSTYLEHDEEKRKKRREERKQAAEEQGLDPFDLPDDEEEEQEDEDEEEERCALDWSMVREYDGIVRMGKKPTKGLDVTWEVQLSRGPEFDAPLGMTLDYSEDHKALVVLRISELGMVHKWNCNNGNLRIRVNDLIVGVNSVIGKPVKMLKEMNKPQEAIELRCMRKMKAVHWVGSDFGTISGQFVKRSNLRPQSLGRVTLHE